MSYKKQPIQAVNGALSNGLRHKCLGFRADGTYTDSISCRQCSGALMQEDELSNDEIVNIHHAAHIRNANVNPSCAYVQGNRWTCCFIKQAT